MKWNRIVLAALIAASFTLTTFAAEQGKKCGTGDAMCCKTESCCAKDAGCAKDAACCNTATCCDHKGNSGNCNKDGKSCCKKAGDVNHGHE
jgi:hypothetical protein